MKKPLIYLLLIVVLLLGVLLAWDTTNRRPLRTEQTRKFVVNKQTLATETENA